MKVINSFPGYKYVSKMDSDDNLAHNYYRGEDVGFGGYVFAEPGIYGRTVTFDVASMHPHSILAMNCFGEYTQRFKDIVDARIAIKHKDFDHARTMLNGALAKYLTENADTKSLTQALKIAINSVYGLTSASFDNPFRDSRNENNIVALRGALFMVNLKHEIQERGFRVIHVKTDSIKVVEPDEKIFNFIMDYGLSYGYSFEVEHIFEKICLVNNAVYIAKLAEDDPDWLDSCKKAEAKGLDIPTRWTATGAQFAQPYVFKSLFSKEPIEFRDMCETKEVNGSLYLDMNENLQDVSMYEKEKAERKKHDIGYSNPVLQSATDEELDILISKGHSYHFVGKVGQFCPIKEGAGGGELLREKDGKYSAATGTKGFRWLESETVQQLNKEDDIDISYYRKLVDDAIDNISNFGNFDIFVSEEKYEEAPFNGAKIEN